MIGNSSSGILEATSFGTPMVNARGRQTSRERTANTVDVPVTGDAVCHAIDQALYHGRCACQSIYGDGQSAPRIRDLDLVRDLSLSATLLNKIIRY